MSSVNIEGQGIIGNSTAFNESEMPTPIQSIGNDIPELFSEDGVVGKFKYFSDIPDQNEKRIYRRYRVKNPPKRKEKRSRSYKIETSAKRIKITTIDLPLINLPLTMPVFINNAFFQFKFIGKYKGDSKNNLPDGRGSVYAEFSNGNLYRYTGDFLKGKRYGYGSEKLTFSNGLLKKYLFKGVCNWDSIKRYGSGSLTISYRKGNVLNQVYKGLWLNGRHTGRGEFTVMYRTGMIIKKHYSGEWYEGRMCGQGELTHIYRSGCVESRVIQGLWLNGRLTVPSTVIYTYRKGVVEKKRL